VSESEHSAAQITFTFDVGRIPMAIGRTVELAEELGFDSVWAAEHIIVGPKAGDP